MAKFSDVAKGTFARRRISLDINGESVAIDVRVLSPIEEADVLGKAATFAKERGIEKPEEGDSLFDLGQWIHTAAIACVDPDSPENAPVPFFDGGAEQIISSRVLTRHHLAYLFHHQELWQDECSPYEKKLQVDNFITFAQRIAEGDIHPFVSLPPATRWLFVRGLASQLVNSLTDKSRSGSSSPGNTPSSRSDSERMMNEPTEVQ